MPQTLAEKILAMHSLEKGVSPGRIVRCRVSMVLANDITAPLAIDSFSQMGAATVFDRDRVALVCDHFTPNRDIASAQQVKKVREFAREQGITHYYEGGESGVEHALLPELGLVGPGDIVIGADSHTCTYGALGAFATGLGSTDVAAGMALGETWFKVPESIRVEINGRIPPDVCSKDIILKAIGELGVDGALYRALEFSGETVQEMDIEARMTMANMAIEAGGKAGLFAADKATAAYCREHNRRDAPEMYPDEGAKYSSRVDIDASGLVPQVACPHLPDNVCAARELGDVRVDQVVLGSCTNGRISDLRQAAEIIRGRHVAPGVRFIVLPATPAVYSVALKEGLLEIFLQAGAIIGPPTCGPCLGGHMGILAEGEVCLATTNRNFKGRMGSLDSFVYLAGPRVAAATAVQGRISDPGEIQ
ncbi:MAG: 3-isopropylmalate dehydratase large subunit [Desulfonatronovibrionaceae bacterium]